MTIMRIDLFGKFDISCNGAVVAGLEGRKAQELLAFMLLQRPRAFSREYLAELLWGQRAPAQSKKYLRQTLWQIQSALAAHCQEEDATPLTIDGEWVRANQDCALWLDVAVFEAAYDLAQGTPGSDLDDARAEGLRQAVQLYRGDLLQGCYEDWCIFERERLQNMYLAMLDKLMDCCQQHGQYELGLGFGNTILRFDRARERTHRRIMRLYYLAGDRTSALRQYEQLVRALHEELDVKPSKRSVALFQQIRSDDVANLPPPTNGASSDLQRTQGRATPADPRLHLSLLHQRLMQMQRQLRQEIETIERALTEG